MAALAKDFLALLVLLWFSASVIMLGERIAEYRSNTSEVTSYAEQ